MRASGNQQPCPKTAPPHSTGDPSAGMGVRTSYATSLFMEHFDLDAGQAVAQLVKVSKRQSDSIETAARMCVAANLSGDRYPGPLEPVGDQPRHRRMAA